MPRIRSIKPEFWDSPDTIRASLRARLLYVAMWNWADDYGIGDANLPRLISFAFPGDDVPASEHPRLSAEVSECFGVVFFLHGGRPFYWIPTWEQHQRTEKKARQRVPFPEPGKPAPDQDREPSEESVGSSDTSRGSSGAGTRGTRGTGELGEQRRNTPPELRSEETEEEPSKELALLEPPAPVKPKGKRRTYSDDFEAFWSAYPRHDDKLDASKAWEGAILNATPEEITAGAARYRDDPNRTPRFTKLPGTWLRAGSWANGPLPRRRDDTQQEKLEASSRETLATLHRMGVA